MLQCMGSQRVRTTEQEARQEIQTGLDCGPCSSKREQKKVAGSFSREELGGEAGALLGVRARVCPGFRPEELLRCVLPTPLWC